MEGRSYIGIGVALGVSIGAALGIALDNLVLGISIGVAIGAGLGLVFDQQNSRRRRQADKNNSDGTAPHVASDSHDHGADSGGSDGGGGD